MRSFTCTAGRLWPSSSPCPPWRPQPSSGSSSRVRSPSCSAACSPTRGGYLIGRKWGRAILRGTIGKLPLIRHHIDKNLDRAEEYLHRRGPHAVVLGRFTAGLRVMVPGLAGMSKMHYWRFLLFNVIGGGLWATTFVLLGYFGGAAWHQVAGIASRV